MIELMRVIWVGHVACVSYMRNVQKTCYVKKGPFERPRHHLKSDIKTDREEIW
jgi:hypothetical protein